MSTLASNSPGTDSATLLSWSPSARELDDIETLLRGAYPGLRGLLGPEDLAAVAAHARLGDGTPWPVPVTLRVPHTVAGHAGRDGALVLLDEEGAAVGVVDVERVWAVDENYCGIAGPVRSMHGTDRGSHRWLLRDAARMSHKGRLLGLLVDRPLHAPQIARLRIAARELDAGIRLFPVTGSGRRGELDAPSLVRMCLALRAPLAADVVPIAVPHHGDAERDRILLALVAQAYGATHLPGPLPAWPVTLPQAVELPMVVRNRRSGAWEWTRDVPAEDQSVALGADEIGAEVQRMVRAGQKVPDWMTGAAVVREMRRAGGTGGQGFTVLLTGLSGSGKSTIGRTLHTALLERTERTVTLLDGDVVRRMLSSELAFSREHRELNVRRIGWVASEITRHGGIAVCTPIAPYSASRAEMGAMVRQHGGFLLVHVATSLEVCEARDRKGLYAKARAGQLPEFTGISDPYEAPDDADLVIDTASVEVEAAVEQVLSLLAARGWLVLEPDDCGRTPA